jgi:hypothetical protein
VTDAAAPDPTEEDEHEALRLQRILDTTELRAHDTGLGGDATSRCGSCRYYLNPGDALAYCWHPQLRILVGSSWRCRHHAPAPEGIR